MDETQTPHKRSSGKIMIFGAEKLAREWLRMYLINDIASDEIMDRAFQWLCKRRKNYSHNNDKLVKDTEWPNSYSMGQKIR